MTLSDPKPNMTAVVLVSRSRDNEQPDGSQFYNYYALDIPCLTRFIEIERY